jgi:hypothetical protein
MVKNGDVHVGGLLSGDTTAEKRLFGHVNNVANATAEGGICVREQFV